MGIVSFGAPQEIIEKIRSSFQVAIFVETGTYQGATAAWASAHFEKVFTIEGSSEFHRQAQKRHADKGNIEFLLGDSRSMLRQVLSRLDSKQAIFWLDAHWMPGSFGQAHECPLLDEIDAIHQSTTEHFIIIDDARLFLAPPPLPHRAPDWPDISTVLSVLNKAGRPANYTVVYQDVIISIPSSGREAMQTFYQAQTTADSLAAMQPTVHPVIQILREIKHRLLANAGGGTEV